MSRLLRLAFNGLAAVSLLLAVLCYIAAQAAERTNKYPAEYDGTRKGDNEKR